MTDRQLVYSTAQGSKCPRCQCELRKCKCTLNKPVISTSKDGVVRITRQTQGKKGSGVSIITGLNLPDQDLKDLARHLKQKCGAGGTIKEGQIEIQTDNRPLLAEELTKKGYQVKIAGG